VTLRACETTDNGVEKGIDEVNKSMREKVDTSDRVDQKPTDEKGQERPGEKEDDLSWLEGDEWSNSLNKNIPDYPTSPCPKCGKDEWGLTPEGQYYCQNCEGET
jgi:hypothetical protein